MAPNADRANILIAQARLDSWSGDLARDLAELPIDLHWSRSDAEALELAVSGLMHVAVLDAMIPPSGALSLLRRFRGIGLALPCLLVCDEPDDRLLRDALELDVFSVLSTEMGRTMLRPMVLRAFRRVHPWEWAESNVCN